METKQKQFDFKETLSARAYTLVICWRWKKIDEEIFGSKEYHKRSVEQIKESENLRMEMHKKAVMELTRFYKFTEKEAIKILQKECERLITKDVRKLKEDEMWCGCCRIILKRKDWEKHQKENQLLHNYLSNELMKISQEQTLLRLQIVKDKQEVRNSSQP
jgi:hypothetical protein